MAAVLSEAERNLAAQDQPPLYKVCPCAKLCWVLANIGYTPSPHFTDINNTNSLFLQAVRAVERQLR
jgi:hypothetical protein